MDPQGSIFVLNLVCRNVELKRTYMSSVKKLFPVVLTCDVPDEVNTLLFCFSQTFESSNSMKQLIPLIKESILRVSSGFDDSQPSQKSKDKKKQNSSSNNSSNKSDPFSGILSEVESLSGYFKILTL